MQEATEASLEVMVEQNASMLHALATAYGEQRRFEAMQDVLGELLLDANEGLVYVRVVDADGVALVTAGMPQMQELPEAQRSPTLQRGNGSQHLIHIRTPLLLEGNTVGFLQFGVSASVLAIAQQAIFRQGAMIALAEIILTLLLLSSIGYLLTRNLRRLLDGSLALAEGRLAHRIPEKGNDELSDLAKRFNLMADSLQARIDELDQTASKLRGSEERYALAMKGANDGLWDWDIPAKTLYVSQRFSDIFGLPQGASKISQDEIPKRMNPAELDSRRE
ncbi:HAMP domain-containing protein [Azoarcus taiwanensis]|uniref:HAMP domain-containing protein n=1 Tax=Azoarcus taiwanensis TaxID=666964 RepID=UPI001FEC9D9D|nr:HAMP domain-containing protein [Azoarcus taiwanensis]